MKSFRFDDYSEIEFVRTVSKDWRPSARAKTSYANELHRDLRAGRLRLVWPDAALNFGLPAAVVASQETLKTTLERLIALPGGISPFTSVVRAWDVEDLALLSETPNNMNSLLASAFVGLVIGELHRALGKEADFRQIGLDIVRRTLSFTCAQAASRGYPEIAMAAIASRWLEVSQLTGNTREASTAIATAKFSAFACATCFDQTSTVSAYDIAKLIHSWLRDDEEQGQNLLIGGDSLLEHVAFLASSQSREARVKAIEVALSEALSRGGEPLEIGFLISLIDPGSFDFFDFANRYDKGDGSVTLAYSMFAGILGASNTLGKFRGFGMNIYSNGLNQTSFIESDISLAELRILKDPLRRTAIDFRTRSPSSVEVELIPGVCGSFFNGVRRRQGATLPHSSQQEVDSLLKRLSHVRLALDVAYAALDEVPEVNGKNISNSRRQRRPS